MSHVLSTLSVLLFFAGSTLANEPARTGDDVPNATPDGNAAADPLAADRAAIQGCWTYKYANQNGVTIRVERVANGDISTYSEFDPHENLIHSHRSVFRLSRDGETRVYSYSDTEVIAGPNVGARQAGPVSFLYRIDGDTFYEIWGMRDSDAQMFRLVVWKRKK